MHSANSKTFTKWSTPTHIDQKCFCIFSIQSDLPVIWVELWNYLMYITFLNISSKFELQTIPWISIYVLICKWFFLLLKSFFSRLMFFFITCFNHTELGCITNVLHTIMDLIIYGILTPHNAREEEFILRVKWTNMHVIQPSVRLYVIIIINCFYLCTKYVCVRKFFCPYGVSYCVYDWIYLYYHVNKIFL